MNSNGITGTDENYSPASQQSLVDGNLTSAAKAARDRATMALIPATGRRVTASFLGRDDYEKVEKHFLKPMAAIMLECLPEYVHSRGGQIVWSTRMSNGEESLNAVLYPIRVDGRDRLLLSYGYLFIYFPDELVVVSAELDYSQPRVNVCVRSSVGPGAFFNAWSDYARGHNVFRGRAFFADGVLIERKHACGWDDIFLPDATKQLIRRHTEGFLANLSRLRGLGVKTRRGLILAGPPGTGKTLLGKVLSQTLKGVSFMWVAPRHIESAASFEEIMSLARFVAPATVFLEDLDLFGQEREGNKWIGLAELLNQLDGAIGNQDVICIATTNRPEVIEQALLATRPGRFDRVVKFEAMDSTLRRQFLQKLLAKAVIDPQDAEYLVEATDGYTGAQIEECTNTLYILAAEAENTAAGENTVAENQPGDAASNDATSADGNRHISITRQLVDTALDELRLERKARLGFHVA